MIPRLAARNLSFFGAGVCFLSLAIAYLFMERYLLLEPCPLCILDRIVVGLLGLVFLAHGNANPSTMGGYLPFFAASALLLSAGLTVAGRHIYLQNRPPEEMPINCLSDSEAAKGLIELIEKAFDANADCGIIAWEFLGLSIPEQVMLLFVGFCALLALQLALVAREGRARAA